MKFFNKSILGLLLLIPSITFAAHTSDRKLYATDIVNKTGASVLKLPSIVPSANRAGVFNNDGEIFSSSVTATELNYLSGVTSNIQTQLDAISAGGGGGGGGASNTLRTLRLTADKNFTSAEWLSYDVIIGDKVSGDLTIGTPSPSTVNGKGMWVLNHNTAIISFIPSTGYTVGSNYYNSNKDFLRMWSPNEGMFLASDNTTFNKLASVFGDKGSITIFGNITVDYEYPEVIINRAGGNITATLPPVSATNLPLANKRFLFINDNGGIMSFSGPLNGYSPQVPQGGYIEFVQDGSSWAINRTNVLSLMVGQLPAINGGVPSGGTMGQVLTKNSATNYDASWVTPAGGGGGGAPTPPINLDAPSGAFPNMIHFTHSSRDADTSATNGVIMGFPNGQNGFEIKNQFSADGNERITFSLSGGQQFILDPRGVFVSGSSFMPLSGFSLPSAVGAFGTTYTMDGVNDSVVNYFDLTSANNLTILPTSNPSFFTKPVYYFGKSDSSTHTLTIQAKSGEYLNGALNGSITISTQFEWLMITALAGSNGWAVTTHSIPASGSTQPTCSVNTRGQSWTIPGGSGVADIFQVCTKDASNAYSWVTK